MLRAHEDEDDYEPNIGMEAAAERPDYARSSAPALCAVSTGAALRYVQSMCFTPPPGVEYATSEFCPASFFNRPPPVAPEQFGAAPAELLEAEPRPVAKVKAVKRELEEAAVPAKQSRQENSRRSSKVAKQNKPSTVATRHLNRVAEIRRRKELMAYPKNSFLLRCSDLDTPGADFLWCVDNHQLLLKYVYEGLATAGGESGAAQLARPAAEKRTYVRTDRYAGWFSNEYWKFVDVSARVCQDGNRVHLQFPSAGELRGLRAKLLARKEAEEAAEARRPSKSDDASASTQDTSSRDQFEECFDED